MTTDHLPDDHLSAQRARVAAAHAQTMALIGRMECELLAARAEANRLADELVREMAARGLAEQQLALAVAGQAYGVDDVAGWIKALYVVAEAAKSMAVDQGWEVNDGEWLIYDHSYGAYWRSGEVLARALLQVGPSFDWRTP